MGKKRDHMSLQAVDMSAGATTTGLRGGGWGTRSAVEAGDENIFLNCFYRIVTLTCVRESHPFGELANVRLHQFGCTFTFSPLDIDHPDFRIASAVTDEQNMPAVRCPHG